MADKNMRQLAAISLMLEEHKAHFRDFTLRGLGNTPLIKYPREANQIQLFEPGFTQVRLFLFAWMILGVGVPLGIFVSMPLAIGLVIGMLITTYLKGRKGAKEIRDHKVVYIAPHDTDGLVNRYYTFIKELCEKVNELHDLTSQAPPGAAIHGFAERVHREQCEFLANYTRLVEFERDKGIKADKLFRGEVEQLIQETKRRGQEIDNLMEQERKLRADEVRFVDVERTTTEMVADLRQVLTSRNELSAHSVALGDGSLATKIGGNDPVPLDSHVSNENDEDRALQKPTGYDLDAQIQYGKTLRRYFR